MSIIGVFTGRSLISPSVDRTSSPPRTMLTSALVPPMSIPIASGVPSARLTFRAATAPAAGPERTVRIAFSVAWRVLKTPPPECITFSGTPTPRSSMPASSRAK